ncbi:MAG: sarcosine oxidase subunit gamma [Hyphomicrobiaceae bacterium]
MAELRSAFHDCQVSGNYGPTSEGGPAVRLSEAAVGGLMQLAGWGAGIAAHVQPALDQHGHSGIGDFEVAQSNGNVVSFRIAPDRQLVHAIDKSLLDRAIAPLNDNDVAKLDLTHARAVIRIEGDGAEDLFARLATIDFRSPRFAPGRFSQSGIHHTGVLIHRLTTTRFEIYVPSSFAASLWEYICVCTKPFGYDVSK